VDYYTDANLNVDLAVLDVFREGTAQGGPVTKASGEVRVTAIVTLFKKIKLNTHENIGAGPVNLPELEMHTTAYWFCLPFSAGVNSAVNSPRLQDSLIGLSNVLGNAAPVYLMCGSSDIQVMYQTRSPFTGLPTVFIYDNYPGGVGFSDKLFELHDEVFDMAEKLVENCECESGCPSCVGPAGEFSEFGNPKGDTMAIIRYIRGEAPDLIFS